MTHAELFCSACISGDRRVVQSLLAARPELKTCQGSVRTDHREFMKQSGADGGWSPLHLAAHYGQIEIVRLLLASGAPINVTASNKIGNTPLMAAIVGGNVEIMRLILESGADPKLTDATGLDAHVLAKASKISAAIQLLETYFHT